MTSNQSLCLYVNVRQQCRLVTIQSPIDQGQTSHQLVSRIVQDQQTIRSVKLNLRPTIPVQLENQPNNKFTAYKSVQIVIQLTSITIRAYKSVWLDNQPQQPIRPIISSQLDNQMPQQQIRPIKSSQIEIQMPQQPIRPIKPRLRTRILVQKQ